MKKIIFLFLFLFSSIMVFSQESEDEMVGDLIESEYNKIFFPDENLDTPEESAVFSENDEENKEKVPLRSDGILLMYVMPSALGHAAGWNSYMSFRDDFSSVKNAYKFSIEARGEIISKNNFTFAYAFANDAYMENTTTDANLYLSLNFSLGGGIYFHPRNSQNASLTGLQFIVYPVFSLPILAFKDSENGLKMAYDDYAYKWKIVAELGLSLKFNTITFMPYLRGAIGWTKSSSIRPYMDVGIAIGLYFLDRNYDDSNI